MPPEIKHSIKGDMKDYFLILNCSYITVTSFLSLLGWDRVVVFAAFSFCFINSLVSFLFYRLRLMRYQRTENIQDLQKSG